MGTRFDRFYDLVSQGFEFTEPVLGVAFLIAPEKQFMFCNVLANFPINQGVLDLIGTSLDGMDLQMAAQKDLGHFLQIL